MGLKPGDVDRIALGDEPSKAVADVWEKLVGFAFLATQMPPERTRAFLAELDRTDAVMPLTDPTGYRAIVPNIADYREIATAFLAFQVACGRVTERALRRAGGR